VPPWFSLSRIDVTGSKNEARRNYNNNLYKFRLRIYIDDSNLNNRITTSAISYDTLHSEILSTIDNAQMYHSEIVKIKQTICIFLDSIRGTDQLFKETAIIYIDN
jgi:ribosomal protein L28